MPNNSPMNQRSEAERARNIDTANSIINPPMIIEVTISACLYGCSMNWNYDSLSWGTST
jgi:hypothetical protein